MRTVRVLLLGECRVASRVIVKGSLEPYLWRMSEDGITRVVILGVISGGEESPQMLCNRPSIMVIDEDGKYEGDSMFSRLDLLSSLVNQADTFLV